jgi:hypothetical protein
MFYGKTNPEGKAVVTRLGHFCLTLANGIEASAINHCNSYTEGRNIMAKDDPRLNNSPVNGGTARGGDLLDYVVRYGKESV